jgi:hypothetical protein
MTQNNLFMVKIVRERQNKSGSKGLQFYGSGDDGHDYALKTLAESALLPATEWVCYSLYRAIGISTPDFLAVERLDGTVAFGSRMEQENQFLAPFPIIEFVKLFSANIVAQSRIYGADAFWGNRDRHLGNFLFRNRSSGLLPIAFDFDQAWVNLSVPFGAVPWVHDCKSKIAMNFLETRGYFDKAAALQAGQLFLSLPDDALSRALATCHPSWTTGMDWEATLDVWNQIKSHWMMAKTSLN